MGTFKKSREWYDTRIPVMQLLSINLYITLDSLLQKASNGVEPHYLDIWVAMHRDDPQSEQKLVSTNFFYSYVCIIICFIRVNKLIIVQERSRKVLKKKHGPDVETSSSASKLNWVRNCDRRKNLCNNYCKAINRFSMHYRKHRNVHRL
jgi:hypothetical protein